MRNAFEARFGEKVDCRVIEWSVSKEDAAALKALEDEARTAYVHLMESEEAFAEAARKQKNTALAAGEGKVKPFARFTLENENIEKHALALRAGQVSPLIPVPNGFVVIKCDRRIPADTTVPFEKVRAELHKDVLERKAAKEIPKLFAELREKAQPERLLETAPDEEQPYGYVRNFTPGQASDRVVAYLYGRQVKLTREDLGEYLIQRFGVNSLDLLINTRIIDNICKIQNVSVTEAEVEAELLIDCAKQDVKSRAEFIQKVLVPNKTSVYVYKEDILRPRLLLTKLCRDRVKVTQEDLQAAFDAHYGEKIEGRIIMWPASEENNKFILQEYGKIRDNEKAFDTAARQQASPTLAKTGGRLDQPIGRHTTGNEVLEKAMFALKEHEVSCVIGTPDGLVVFKCDKRLPADGSKKIEDCRAELTKEIVEKKIQLEMPIYFKEVRDQADPHALLKEPN